MKGRTMYVVPFLMGPPGSRFSKVGVEITDSKYVVLNMRIMTRVGKRRARSSGSPRATSPDACTPSATSAPTAASSSTSRKRIRCGRSAPAMAATRFSARSAWRCVWPASLAAREGWLAEHMLILGLKNPKGEMHYITGAFPSACGKTNLAMLVPPASMPGWQAWTVGDDIAWLRPGADGRLWAVNPESGFFGVVPGTSRFTNPNAFDMIQRNTIYTNVALRPDGTPWWEGHDDPPPAEALDWQGRPWTPAIQGEGGASQQPFHCSRSSVRFDLAGV